MALGFVYDDCGYAQDLGRSKSSWLSIEAKEMHFSPLSGNDCDILDGGGFTYCNVYKEIRSLRIMWDIGYLKF